MLIVYVPNVVKRYADLLGEVVMAELTKTQQLTNQLQELELTVLLKTITFTFLL